MWFLGKTLMKKKYKALLYWWRHTSLIATVTLTLMWLIVRSYQWIYYSTNAETRTFCSIVTNCLNKPEIIILQIEIDRWPQEVESRGFPSVRHLTPGGVGVAQQRRGQKNAAGGKRGRRYKQLMEVSNVWTWLRICVTFKYPQFTLL